MASKGDTDEKVVQLMLDSKEFDSNAKKSIQTLDDLKKAFEFEGASKGFEEVERAARKVDLSIMENGIQKVQDHFNLLNTIATTALERITNAAIDTGVNLVKSLSTDQIMTGWSKFEDKTSAVQTIMSATADQFTDTGEQMEFVEGQLERLNWFTDETSYKFLDMVNNIGKFTSNSVELDVSVEAMQGISTWAARSGAHVEEAGRAMYNLSQAIAVGAVKLQDWKSIENANMATAEFKRTAIETAESMGTLKRVSDDVWSTLDGKVVTVKNFNANLSEGWFTSEVLLDTLSKYGNFATELGDLVAETGVETTKVLKYIDQYIDGTLNMRAASIEMGMSVEDLTEVFDRLSSEEYKLGRESFKAAQETKTLTEAIDYVKEAVSSGWMRTFEYIFGNYTEAKELWSELAETMYDVFVASGDARNELLSFWKAAGGRDILIEGFKELYKNIDGILTAIRDAYDNIFGKEFDEQLDDLLRLTEGFRDFAASITFTDSTFQDFLRILESVFRVLKTLKNVIGTVLRALEPAARILNKIAGVILNLVANMAELLSLNLENLFSEKRLQAVYDILNFIVTLIAYLAMNGLGALGEAFRAVMSIVDMFFTTFMAGAGGVEGILDTIVMMVTEFYNQFLAGSTVANTFVDIFLGALGLLIGGAETIIDTVVKILTGRPIDFNESFGNITGWFTAIVDVIESLGLAEKFGIVGDMVLRALDYVRQLFADLGNAESEIRQLLGAIKGEFIGFYEWFKAAFAELNAGDIADIAFVASLAFAVVQMANLFKATKGLINGLTGTVGAFNATLKALTTTEKQGFMQRLEGIFNKTKIIQIGLAAVMLVAALNELNKLDLQRTMQSVLMIGLLSGVMLVSFKAYAKIKESLPKKEEKENKLALYVLQMSAGLLLISKALTEVSNALAAEDGMKRMVQSLATLGVVISAMTGISILLAKQDVGDISKAGVAMVGMSVALTMLVIPLKAIGAMPWQQALQGCLAVMGMLTTMGVAAKLMENIKWSSLLALGVSFTAIAGAMLIISAAVMAMGLALGSDNGMNGLGGVIASILLMATAIAGLSAVAGQVDAVKLMMLSMVIVSFAGAITLLSVSIAMLQEIPISQIAGTLLAFTLSLSMLMVVANACTGAVPALLAIAALFISIGASIALFATGVRALVEAFAIFTTTVVALGELSNQMGEDMPNAIDKGLEAIEQIIRGFLQMIPGLIPDVVVAAASIVGGLIAGVTMMIPAAVAAFMLLCTSVLAVIGALGGPLMQALISVVRVLRMHIQELLYEVGLFIEELFAGIGVLIYHAAKGLWKMFLGAFTGEVIPAKGEVSKGAHEALDGVDDAIKEKGKDFKEHARTAGEDAGTALGDGMKDTTEVHSPSEVFISIMEWCAKGLMKGGDESLIPAAGTVGSATGTVLANSAKSTAYAGLSELGTNINDWTLTMQQQMGLDLSNIDGLFNFSGAEEKKKITGPKTIIDKFNEDFANAKASEEAKEGASNMGFDIGSSLGDGVGKGAGSSAKKNKEKTAEEIVKEYADALSKAYSEGSKYLDLEESKLSMEETLWNIKHKEGDTDAEKEAYALAKKQFEIDQMNSKMKMQLDNLALLNAQYLDKLNLYGSGASETADAFNALISGRLELLEMYNNKMDLLSEEVEHDPEAFVAATKEIAEWRDLVEKGFITNEQMLTAAKDKIGKVVGAQQHEFENANTELDKQLAGLVEGTESLADLTGEAWDQLATDSLKTAVSSLGEGAEELAWSTTDVISRALGQVVSDGQVFGAAEGLGVNINDGTINGMESTKKTLFGTADSISQETLDTMADTLGVNSPSKYTTEYGEYLDEGLIQGIKNREAAVIEQAISTAIKALKAAKKALGVRSPSEETYDIGNFFDQGLANGISDNAKIVKSSIYGMVDNLLDTTDSELAQNGSKSADFLNNLFDLPDEDLHLRVVVDTDSSSLDDSMTLLEQAQMIGAKTPAFASINTQAQMPTSVLEGFDNSTLQGMYDLLSSYIDFQKQNASKDKSDEGEKTVVNVSMTQNNTSPKAISATDTYRNTQKQLNAVKSGISRVVRKI